MDHLTPKEIAEKFFPVANRTLVRNDVGQPHRELISLIKERDQQVWDAACKAQREIITDPDNPMIMLLKPYASNKDEYITVEDLKNSPTPPFKIEGE